ncbi:MAG TPA: hypothetical protein VFP10_00385, partial [Candidatus Eisenbacteria bacterium]|nr:hypothetical protein [Candidatus Eisenbacteria bacterium]
MCTIQSRDAIRLMTAILILGATAHVVPAGAELEGRYLGAYQISEDDRTGTDDFMRHLVDLHALDDLSRSVTLRLDLSMAYRFKPGESQTDFLDSRLFGDLRHSSWRLHAQFVPWQDAAPGIDPPRRRAVQLGLDLTPPRLPHLRLVYDRHDRETVIGRSASEDFRIQGTHTMGPVGSRLGYRRIETSAQGGIAAPTNTDQWTAGVLGAQTWGPVSGSAGYEAEYNTFETRDRLRTYYTQRVDVGGQWNPMRQLRVGAATFARWGRSEDNGPSGDQPIDEKFLSGNVAYLPIREIEIGALREYRSTVGLTGNEIADYLRLQAIFRKDILRGLLFQNGYVYSVDLHSRGGSVPQDGVYFLIDGRVRRGVAVRGELRFARELGDEASTGTQVRRLLGLRVTPFRPIRLEGTWSFNSYPEVTVPSPIDSLPATHGPAQDEREWDRLAGYQPTDRLAFSGSYRGLTGRGRIDRDERYGA